MPIFAETDQDDNDSNLFGPEIDDTDMSASAALQTAIGGTIMAFIGMNRLLKTLPTDEYAQHSEVVAVVTEKLKVLAPSIKTLAEWLETVNHAVFGMCIHAPVMEGVIQWHAVELRVSSEENAMRLGQLLDMITAKLN